MTEQMSIVELVDILLADVLKYNQDVIRGTFGHICGSNSNRRNYQPTFQIHFGFFLQLK